MTILQRLAMLALCSFSGCAAHNHSQFIAPCVTKVRGDLTYIYDAKTGEYIGSYPHSFDIEPTPNHQP
jgi:hypothetical protein